MIVDTAMLRKQICACSAVYTAVSIYETGAGLIHFSTLLIILLSLFTELYLDYLKFMFYPSGYFMKKVERENLRLGEV